MGRGKRSIEQKIKDAQNPALRAEMAIDRFKKQRSSRRMILFLWPTAFVLIYLFATGRCGG